VRLFSDKKRLLTDTGKVEEDGGAGLFLRSGTVSGALGRPRAATPAKPKAGPPKGGAPL